MFQISQRNICITNISDVAKEINISFDTMALHDEIVEKI